MNIFTVTENKKQYLDLLLLADEDERMIDKYLDRGELLALRDGEAVVAIAVVTDEGNGVLEIKNLATAPAHQGKGHGRRLIEHIAAAYAGNLRQQGMHLPVPQDRFNGICGT